MQQPIFAPDLAALILSCPANPNSYGEIYMSAGADIIESYQYYRIIADILDVDLKIEEVPVSKYLSECPAGHESFICHRIYDLKKMRNHGLKVPGYTY